MNYMDSYMSCAAKPIAKYPHTYALSRRVVMFCPTSTESQRPLNIFASALSSFCCKYFCKTFSVNAIFPNFLTRTTYTFICASLCFMNKSVEPSTNGQMIGFRCTIVHIEICPTICLFTSVKIYTPSSTHQHTLKVMIHDA